MSLARGAAARTLSATSVAIPQHLGAPALEPVRLSGREGINGLFEYELVLKTPDALNLGASGAADFNLDDFIGREISCQIQLDGMGQFRPGVMGDGADHLGQGIREVNALIVDARLWGEEGRHVQYCLTLRPWLHLATLRSDTRIYQNMTVVQLLDELLGKYSFPVEKWLIERYPIRDYQTQYNESDFDFFCRLCQEWGINYFFDHAEGRHRLVLVDNMGAHRPNPSEAYANVEYHAPGWKVDAEYIHAFTPRRQLTSGRYSASDYDYTRPRADLSRTRKEPRPTGHADSEVYQWHASNGGSHYAQPRAGTAPANDPRAEGDQLALLRMQALRTHGSRASASGNLRGMVPGCTFRLRKHPRQDANDEYLILDTSFLIEDVAQDSQRVQADAGRTQQWRVRVDFSAHPVHEVLRPELSRAKPHTHGPQVALVVGPEGENLWTDELGRIKVQFPWDRIGQRDQHSSCWVRVAGTWSGNQLGGIHIPRIGQEVIVDFIGGDPDLPICTGRVHNQLNLPPWALPGQCALSGFRSRELTEGGGGNSAAGRSNHLILDDTERKIQAQLKSDHQSSSLSLGHITRIEDNAGRKDARGEGFELRTDAHGAIRAKDGLLITTEARGNAQAHALDSGETQQRLFEARDLHFSGAEIAQKNKGQLATDQAQVADALKAQNAAIAGDTSAAAVDGEFPELSQPHLVLASPAGIEMTTEQSTHVASVEHTAITSGRHTSIVSGDSVLAVALQAIKLFAAQKGIQVLAAQADIEIQALKTCINMAAKEEITLKADRITIEAKTQLTINGGGSYTEFASGRIESGSSGAHVLHAASHSMVGPSSKGSPALPEGAKPGSGQLELRHRYADGHGLKGAAYEVIDALGQVKTGKLDGDGFATVSGLAPGGARIKFEKDPRDPWDDASYLGVAKWPTESPAAASHAAAHASDTPVGLMAAAMQGAASGAFTSARGSQGLMTDAGGLAQALRASLAPVASGQAVQGLMHSAIDSAMGRFTPGAVDSTLAGEPRGYVPAPGNAAPTRPGAAQLPPGVSLMHTTV